MDRKEPTATPAIVVALLLGVMICGSFLAAILLPVYWMTH